LYVDDKKKTAFNRCSGRLLIISLSTFEYFELKLQNLNDLKITLHESSIHEMEVCKKETKSQ